MLQDLAQKTDVPVIASAALQGTVSLSNPDGTVGDVLDTLSRQGHLVWWFDGIAIHVEPPADMVSRLIALDGVSVGALRQQMEEVGLADPKYPILAGSGAQMVRVVSPKGYADAVDELAKHMSAVRKEAQTEEGDLPRIIRGGAPRSHPASNRFRADQDRQGQ
ncbi:hypothetical protein [Paracoccus sp. (in: a-proteobacteria)]|uniref:hypothetical protein n=1 Tax=Paracoccus sp. TaxID=267 RepID=UPI003A8BE94A